MGKYTTIAALGLLLTGCGFSSWGTAVRETIRTGGAQAMDQGLVNAEWVICKESSVGSIHRRYGISKARADAWRVICKTDSAVTVVGPDHP